MLMWSLQSRNHELACVRENLKAELMTLRALAREADLCRSCGDRIARVCIDSHYVRSLGLILVPPRLRIFPSTNASAYTRLHASQSYLCFARCMHSFTSLYASVTDWAFSGLRRHSTSTNGQIYRWRASGTCPSPSPQATISM